MPKMITRSLFTTTIQAARVAFKNGKLEETPLEAITVEGQLRTKDGDELVPDQAAAIKLVQKKYGKSGQYVIKDMTVASKTYGLPLDFFMANAKEIVSANTDEEKAGEQEAK